MIRFESISCYPIIPHLRNYDRTNMTFKSNKFNMYIKKSTQECIKYVINILCFKKCIQNAYT